MERTTEIIERACNRHGGLDIWQSLERVEAQVDEFGGAIPFFKGAMRDACRMEAVVIEPHERRASIRFRGGRQVTFERGDILEDGERYGAFRERFSSLPKKFAIWGPRETAYFFGYALTHYLSLPFSLHPDVNCGPPSTLRRTGSRGELDWIEVEYPKNSDTHSRKERFWFDATGLLARHDYHAEIIGPGFHGAHHSLDYHEVGGALVAHRRRVTLRLGAWSTPLPVLYAKVRLTSGLS